MEGCSVSDAGSMVAPTRDSSSIGPTRNASSTAWKPQRLPIPIRASDVRERRSIGPSSSSATLVSATIQAASDDEQPSCLDAASTKQLSKSWSQPAEKRARRGCQRSLGGHQRQSIPSARRRKGAGQSCEPIAGATGPSQGAGRASRPSASPHARGDRVRNQSSSTETLPPNAGAAVPLALQTMADERVAQGSQSTSRASSCETPPARQENDPVQEKRRLGFGLTPFRQMPSLSPPRTSSLEAARRRSSSTGPSHAPRGGADPSTPGFGAQSSSPALPPSRAPEATLPPWLAFMPTSSIRSSPRSSPRCPVPTSSLTMAGLSKTVGLQSTREAAGAGRGAPRSAAGAPSTAVRRPRGDRGALSQNGFLKPAIGPSHGVVCSRLGMTAAEAGKCSPVGVASFTRGEFVSQSLAPRGGA